MEEEQEDEIQALKAIYDDDFAGKIYILILLIIINDNH
jgi:hypothetical protein